MKNSNVAHRFAIVGRPNVGKSTLFNRIVGGRRSITERISGTTRDRVSAIIKRNGVALEIIDTGGFAIGQQDHISKLIRKQIEIAISAADTILFICDVKEGILPQDEEMLPILRKSGKEIILILSKLDNEKLRENVNEFFKFGLKDIYPVSALHNIGISSLMDRLAENIGPVAKEVEEEAAIKVAIVGRPNVGKSSLINKIINEERLIVHEKPGTTRDSVDIHFSRNGVHFIFIDTAGMRHRRKVKKAVEVYSLLRAEESVKKSGICLIVIDAYEGLIRDDMRILRLAQDSGKGSLLVVNKWDLITNFDMAKYEKALIEKMRYIKNIPVIFTSCKTGLNLEEIFPLIRLIDRNMQAKFSEEQFDMILEFISKSDRIPVVRSGKAIKIYGIRQRGVSPPTFDLLVNKPASVTDDYIEGIKNILRDELGLKGVPVKIHLKKHT